MLLTLKVFPVDFDVWRIVQFGYISVYELFVLNIHADKTQKDRYLNVKSIHCDQKVAKHIYIIGGRMIWIPPVKTLRRDGSNNSSFSMRL